MSQPKKEKEHCLGDLDATTRLVADSVGFRIQKRARGEDGEYGPWVSRWHYTTIKSALEGYTRRTLRGDRVREVKGDFKKLIEVLEVLDRHVAEIGGRLDLEWKQRNEQRDPGV